MGVEQQVDASEEKVNVDKWVQYLVINKDLGQLFSPHAKFAAMAKCPHKTNGCFTVSVTAEAVVPNQVAMREVDNLIKESQVIKGTEGPEKALVQLSEDLAFWSGKQRAALQRGASQEVLDELKWRIDSIVALMRAERQKIEDAKAAAVAAKVAEE